MIRRGELDMPVSMGRLGKLRERARDSLEQNGGVDANAFARLSAQLKYVDGERLLRDALRGDPSLFTRDDSVEAAWRVIDPVLGNAEPVHEYKPGSWGPSAAANIVVSDEGWHDPKSEETARY